MSLSNRQGPDRAASSPLCTFAILSAFTVFSAFSPVAQAAYTTIADNSTAASAGTVSATATDWLATSFTLSELGRGETLLASLVGGTTSGSASLVLYSSDASGLIPESALASFTTVSDASGTLSFSLSGLTLGSGTYWAVLSNATGTSEWSWTEEGTGTGTGFTGAWANSDDAGTTWFSNSTLYPVQASITVSAVPEPGSWWLGLAGLIGVAGMTGMRRSPLASHPHAAAWH